MRKEASFIICDCFYACNVQTMSFLVILSVALSEGNTSIVFVLLQIGIKQVLQKAKLQVKLISVGCSQCVHSCTCIY